MQRLQGKNSLRCLFGLWGRRGLAEGMSQEGGLKDISLELIKTQNVFCYPDIDHSGKQTQK